MLNVASGLVNRKSMMRRHSKTDQEREIRGQTLHAIIIIAPTTINHPPKQRNGAHAKKRGILEVKLRCESIQTYKFTIVGQPTKKGAPQKRVGLSTACYRRRCKKMDETIATGDNSKPFTAAFQT
jgi:hypothetical protein